MKIGTKKTQKITNFYKEGQVLTVPFKSGKNTQINLPNDIVKNLKLGKDKKLHCIVVGNTIQLTGSQPLVTIPVATNDVEAYESHKV